jgi:hypothetical protein
MSFSSGIGPALTSLHEAAFANVEKMGTIVWWISFLHGGVVIVEASSLPQARMFAALRSIGRVAHFAEGHLISEERAALIPEDFIGRMLSSDEARKLRELFERRRC